MKKRVTQFPTLEQVNNASTSQIKIMYNTYNGPKTDEEVAVMKTIIKKHMRVRRLEKQINP